jgi:hypothetical protein
MIHSLASDGKIVVQGVWNAPYMQQFQGLPGIADEVK